MTTQQYCTGGCAPAARLAGRRSPHGSVRGGATPLLLPIVPADWGDTTAAVARLGCRARRG